MATPSKNVQKRLDQDERKRFRALWKAKASNKHIAAVFGIPINSVTYWARKLNLPRKIRLPWTQTNPWRGARAAVEPKWPKGMRFDDVPAEEIAEREGAARSFSAAMRSARHFIPVNVGHSSMGDAQI